MILAFYAIDRSSNPSFAILFYILLLMFSVCFCCFYFDLFFFLFYLQLHRQSPISAFRYKITKGSRYFVLCTEIQPVIVFTLNMLAYPSIFGHTNEDFHAAKHVYRVYITFLISCFSKCLKLLHLSHTNTNC